jgi:hypothetical protein
MSIHHSMSEQSTGKLACALEQSVLWVVTISSKGFILSDTSRKPDEYSTCVVYRVGGEVDDIRFVRISTSDELCVQISPGYLTCLRAELMHVYANVLSYDLLFPNVLIFRVFPWWNHLSKLETKGVHVYFL